MEIYVDHIVIGTIAAIYLRYESNYMFSKLEMERSIINNFDEFRIIANNSGFRVIKSNLFYDVNKKDQIFVGAIIRTMNRKNLLKFKKEGKYVTNFKFEESKRILEELPGCRSVYDRFIKFVRLDCKLDVVGS